MTNMHFMCKKEYVPPADLEKQANSDVTAGLKVSKM
jgi:hypothetical protein